VLVRGETIAAVGAFEAPEGATIINAEGKYLLPGGVDAHTHMDLDVGIARASDDFYTGTVAAACGGTTTIIDHMAFGPKGCALGHQVGVYHELARPAVIDYGFHGVLSHVDGDVLGDMERLLASDGISSYKAYMTYDGMLRDDALLRVLRRAKELGIVVCAHCENDAVIRFLREELLARGHTQPRYHPISRPPSCEAEAVWRFLMLARAAGEPAVYVVHLSSALGLEALRLARRSGQRNVYAESCPQYLLLDDRLYGDDQEGLKYIMSPPLRAQEDLAALWGAAKSGDIDAIATDHCPFFFQTQKQLGARDFTKAPGGAPGVETRMQLLFSEGFMRGRLTLSDVVRMTSTRPAEIFGIGDRKGDIAVGKDADLVLFDPERAGTIAHAALHEHVDYTPYEGRAYRGAPVMTIARGEIIAENGVCTAQKGRGRYLKRTPHA
jgi:dihydropyrimidinase